MESSVGLNRVKATHYEMLLALENTFAYSDMVTKSNVGANPKKEKIICGLCFPFSIKNTNCLKLPDRRYEIKIIFFSMSAILIYNLL